MLTKDMLVNTVAGVVVREVSRTAEGQRVVDVQLDRPSHEAALDELVGVLAQFGFSYVEATVTEWVSKAVDGLVLGATGGGVVGGTTTKNPVVTLIGAIVGAVIGGLAGAEAREIAAEYHVRWNRQRGWVLIKLRRQQPVEAALKPAVA